MHHFFQDMGFIRWPMYVATLFMLVQIGRAAMDLRKPAEARSPMTAHTVLVWGALNALLGILGTVVGLTVAGGVVEKVGEVVPSLLAGGIRVALSTSIFGLLLLTVAVLAWLVLQVWDRAPAQ